MKNTLLILLIILAFAGCKDDECLEPDAGVVYEEWTKVSSDIIYLNSRSVVSIEAYDSNLYVQCVGSYYHLDKDLGLKYNYFKGLDKLPYFWERPKIGRTYMSSESENQINALTFELRPTNPLSGVNNSRGVIIDSIGSYGAGGTYTRVENNEFGILYNTHFGDSFTFIYNWYEIKESKNAPVLLQTTYLGKTDYNPNGGVADVSLVNGVSYCSIQNMSKRVENGVVTITFPFNLRDVVIYKNAIIGIADNFWVGQADEPQLLISDDNGFSWSSVMIGRTLNSGNLKVIDNEILLINGGSVLNLNIDDGSFKVVDMKGTDAWIRDVTKMGDKAVLGTDHGLYYKSWESFLNK